MTKIGLFFLCYNFIMDDLNKTIDNTKKKYREIFVQSLEAIQNRIDNIKPAGIVTDIFEKYPENSDGYNWQKQVLEMLLNEISREILDKWQDVLAFRKEFHCNGCATCCNLACSEFSYEELKEKAKNGDKFAQQFTSIFIPYKKREDAEKIYPEYLEMLKDKGDVYFYHCPKLTECNRCSDYENRPQICRTFPDNPLDILPESCGYYEWKQEVEPVVLMLHSMVEIIDYYKQKIPIEKD